MKEPPPAPVLEGLEPVDLADVDSPVRVYVARMTTEHSRRTVHESLERLAVIASGGHIKAARFPWHRLTYRQTAALRAALAERYSPAGANLRLATLRGVLREAWRLELMSAEAYHRAADLASIPGRALPRGRALDAGERRALFETTGADASPRGRRDLALFALAYGGGLRRAELARLDLADWKRGDEELHVHGKGSRDRKVPARGGVAVALERWLEARGEAAGPLFFPFDRGGQLVRRRMSPQTVRVVCDRRGRAAGIKPFSPHDLRRTAATELLDCDVDLATVSSLLGHSRLETTARYDQRGDRAVRRATGLLHVPEPPGKRPRED